MGVGMLLWLSVGLAADAFAVSLSLGMTAARLRRIPAEAAGLFGLFQGGMPLLGYGLARLFAGPMEWVGRLTAFAVLTVLGIKMIREACGRSCAVPRRDWRTLLGMALATSTDALAVGASLAVLPRQGVLYGAAGIWLCAWVIAAVTALLCLVGLVLGCRIGNRLGGRAGLGGGIILIAIGIKMLGEQIWH